MRIATKAEAIRLRDTGEIGNRWLFWPDIAAYKASGYGGPVVIQYRERNSPYMRYDIARDEFDDVVAEFVANGADPALMYCSPLVVRDWIILQGECTRRCDGFWLHYNTKPMDMRPALKDPDSRHVGGSAAVAVLKHYMDADSYENLQRLLSEYDDGPSSPWPVAVEFTVCDRPVGHLGLRTIFWEVRSY